MAKHHKIDRSAPLKKGESLYVRNKGRYTNRELIKAFQQGTTLKFFGVDCHILDLTYLFFEEDHELEIKASNPLP